MAEKNILRYYSPEENKQFLEEKKEMFGALKEMGWEMSTDPDIFELSCHLYREMSDEHEQAIILSAKTIGRKASQWVEKRVDWESEISAAISQKQRESLLASCYQRAVTDEFLEDVKRRWEKAQFTAVTADYYIIGDVSARRLYRQGAEQYEKHYQYPEVLACQKPLTHDVWKYVSGNDVMGVRPIINGDRFVLQKGATMRLQGFIEIIVPNDFQPRVVDYYAGQYYVVTPHIKKDQEYKVTIKGQECMLTFRSHPILSMQQYCDNAHKWDNHRYKGVSVWTKDAQYQSYWIPVVSTILKGEAWMVSLSGDQPQVEYPSAGKEHCPLKSVKSYLQTQIPARHVIDFFDREKTKVNFTDVEQKEDRQQIHGAKCLFITTEGELLFIREPGKRLDLIGGQVEFGETPIQALIREVEEETGCLMQEEQFQYLDDSLDVELERIWVSHVYVAVAPTVMQKKKFVEGYTFENTFAYMEKSSMGRPWQTWLGRHMLLFHEYFSGTLEVQAMCYLLWGVNPPPIMSISDKTYARIKVRYEKRIRDLLQLHTIEELESLKYYFSENFKTSLTLSYQQLASGDRKVWMLYIGTGMSGDEIRNKMRLQGCTWNHSQLKRMLMKKVEEKVLKIVGNKYVVV